MREPVTDADRQAAWVRANGICAACLMPLGAEGVVHHRRRRRIAPANTAANLVVLHDGCHTWAHAHPNLAREHGIIVATWDDPAQVPMTRVPGLHRGNYVPPS